MSKDVGVVYGIILTETVKDPWECLDISVTYKSMTTKWECNGKKLKCPSECSITLENKSPLDMQKGDKNRDTLIMDPKTGKFKDVGSPNGLIEDWRGKTLNPIEVSEMLIITC